MSDRTFHHLDQASYNELKALEAKLAELKEREPTDENKQTCSRVHCDLIAFRNEVQSALWNLFNQATSDIMRNELYQDALGLFQEFMIKENPQVMIEQGRKYDTIFITKKYTYKINRENGNVHRVNKSKGKPITNIVKATPFFVWADIRIDME